MLLSASFADSDFSGSWLLAGVDISGSVTGDGAGTITGGSLSLDDGRSGAIVNGTYSISNSGVFATSITGAAPLDTYVRDGVVSSTKDMIVGNEHSLPSPNSSGDARMIGLIKHSAGNFTNADFTGTWSFAADQGRGYLYSDGLGHILGGTGVSPDGYAIRFTGGSYAINSDGTFTTSIIANGHTFNFHGAINDSRDLIGLSADDLHAAAALDQNPTVVYFAKQAGVYSNADFSGTWTVASQYVKGTIQVDGAGHITSGNIVDDTGLPYTVTGTYRVYTSGIYYANYQLHTGNQTITYNNIGYFNASRNVVETVEAVADPNATDSAFSLLVRSANRAPFLSSARLSGTAVEQQSLIIPFSTLATATHAIDYDHDTIRFRIGTVNNGRLQLNGVDVTPGVTEIGAGDSLTWIPAANASGLINAFTINGFDGTDLSAAATISVPTALMPKVYLFSSIPTTWEATASTGGKGRFTLYRAGGDLSSPLTVDYSVGGTAADGVNYAHLTGTVTFAAGKSIATVDVLPIEDGKADPTLRVTATLIPDAGPSYTIANAYSTATVNIIDDAPVVYLLKYVPTVYESTANRNGKGQMLLYRTGSTAAALTVNYSVTGTATDGVNYAHLGGTATFAAGKSTATIDVLPLEDGIADPTLNVTATLIPDAGTTYTIHSTYKAATVNIIDDAPTIYTWTSKPYAYKSGKANGQFAVYRTGSTASTLTVNYSVLGGTAVSGTNFTALTGQVTFSAGQSIAYIALLGINDPNQTTYLTVKVGLALDNGPTYRFGNTYNTATAYILNA